jgi:hypothetical protein
MKNLGFDLKTPGLCRGPPHAMCPQRRVVALTRQPMSPLTWLVWASLVMSATIAVGLSLWRYK